MTQVKTKAWAIALLLVLGVFAASALVIYGFGQDIEAAISPVVAETAPADSIYRDEDKGCFTLHLQKVSNGTDPLYNCTAKALYSPDLPISLYPSDSKHQKYGRDLKVHDVGARWPRVFCFEMPGTVAKNQELVLTCNGSHQRHALWRSLSPLSSIRICGPMADDPPADLPSPPDPYCEKQRAGFAKIAR